MVTSTCDSPGDGFFLYVYHEFLTYALGREYVLHLGGVNGRSKHTRLAIDIEDGLCGGLSSFFHDG